VDWLRQIDLEKFLLFTLVLTRVSGLTMTAPIYGTKDVPLRVRALLAVALAVLLTPSAHAPDQLPGVQLAGQLIGRMGGLMLADVFDPTTETSVPMFSRLLFLVTLAVFVCIGGHRMVMAGLLDTFQTIPPGSGVVPLTVADAFVTLGAQSFALGVRAAVPVVTALLLSTLVLGLISRTLPQLNILMVGFGLNAMLTFAVFSLTIGAAAWVFQDQIEPALDTLLEALHAPLRTEWLN